MESRAKQSPRGVSLISIVIARKAQPDEAISSGLVKTVSSFGKDCRWHSIPPELLFRLLAVTMFEALGILPHGY